METCNQITFIRLRWGVGVCRSDQFQQQNISINIFYFLYESQLYVNFNVLNSVIISHPGGK